MTVERKPVAFGDQRAWIEALRDEGELHEVTAQVDWNIELGTIMRMAQGTGEGPALLFSNIKDYNKKGVRGSKVFGCSLSSYRRIAMMLGLPPETHPRELVKVARTILNGAIPPKIVKTGPVKENIITGDDINLLDFPVPHWNRIDGGRYMMTYAGCVTKNPDTNVMNVGVYRGMVADRNHIPIYMYRAQHIGHHALAWQQKGAKEMPIAYVIGWEPSMDFCSGSPVPMGVCEYDVMGSIRGAPVELVKCESHDLYVPATAEIVVEGFLPFDHVDLHAGRPVRGIHRLCRGRARAAADHARDRDHASQRSGAARHDRRLAAQELSPRTRSTARSCVRASPGTCSTAPAFRA